MKKTKIIIGILFILLGMFKVQAQEEFPKRYFGSPLDEELMVTGSFGELRSHHLHSGIDLKTDHEGKKVFAAAGGYVSRIKISTGGFGKAIYITHPNGFVTVYAHLSQYAPAIENFVREQQYKKESFEIELFPTPFQFPILKSDLIAFSGNTGGSEGPHLHFEIRNATTEDILNPLLFGLKIKDTEAPRIEQLIIYPFGRKSIINGKSIPLKCQIEKDKNGIYQIKNQKDIQITGPVYLGIESHDIEEKNNSVNGIYSINLTADGETIYASEIKSFSFSVSRFVDAHVDYAEKLKKKADIQLCMLRPNNKLPIYSKVVKKGILEYTQAGKHHIQLLVKDASGNSSRLKFDLNILPFKSTKMGFEKDEKCTLKWGFQQVNHFQEGSLTIDIPAFSLYDSLCFNYGGKMKRKEFLSDVYKIHDIYTPMQIPMEISINANIPEAFRDKVLLGRLDENGEIISEGGNWADGRIKTKSRHFGDYGIVIDTVAPFITPLVLGEAKSPKIKIKIQDTLSGIKSYRGTIDGNWVLMEYDEKNKMLVYAYDQQIPAGKHIFNLTVFDNKNNVSTLEKVIYFEK